jgi:hypothetical protein
MSTFQNDIKKTAQFWQDAQAEVRRVLNTSWSTLWWTCQSPFLFGAHYDRQDIKTDRIELFKGNHAYTVRFDRFVGPEEWLDVFLTLDMVLRLCTHLRGRSMFDVDFDAELQLYVMEDGVLVYYTEHTRHAVDMTADISRLWPVRHEMYAHDWAKMQQGAGSRALMDWDEPSYLSES